MTKKVLLDTNIIIHREIMDSRVNPDIGLLFNRIEKCGYEKWIHPDTKSELESYNDKKSVKLMGDKIKNYSVLKNISEDSKEISKIRAEDKTKNSINDTNLLKEVFNKRVDFLITEDKNLLRKAEKLGISSKVYDIYSFLNKLMAENPEFNDYNVLSVKKTSFGAVNINDSFFDSLRNDYPGFNERFNRKAEDPAYVYYGEQDKILGFLYLKPENENEPYYDINPIFPPKRRLKIGTFKVDYPGQKLGERFLKITFDNAINRKVEEIYVTVHNNDDGKQRLINLLEDFGFCYRGTKGKNEEELVYVRDFSKKFNVDFPSKTFPYISKSCKIFMCPIYPEYHTDLLPDSILTTEKPSDFSESQPYRNAIRKIFISRSINRNLHSGDLILFYRTGGLRKSVITTVGIIEDVIDGIPSEDDFIRLCKKRSVFDEEELKRRRNYSYSRPFIVNFLYAIPLSKRLNMETLIKLGIIKDVWSAPRGFEEISKEQFDLFIKESNLNESYIVD